MRSCPIGLTMGEKNTLLLITLLPIIHELIQRGGNVQVTKIECPNCHGTLHIPDGMKEGFVTCEYCGTKVYLEPNKPNITQNIHIDNLNLGGENERRNRFQETARQKASNVKAAVMVPLIGVLIACGLIPFSFLFTVKQETSPTPTVSGKSAPADFRTVPRDPVIKQFVEKAFGKKLSAITKEDFASLSYLEITKVGSSSSDDSRKWQFLYAKEIRNDGTPQDPKTLEFQATEQIDETDLQVFPGLKSLSIGSDVSFFYGEDAGVQNLKNLTQLQYFSADHEDLYTLASLLANPAQIKSLDGVLLDKDLMEDQTDTQEAQNSDAKSDQDAPFKAFSSLEHLSVSVNDLNADGLLFLRSFPQLQSLHLSIFEDDKTVLDLSPLSTLSSCTDLSIEGPYEKPVKNIAVLSGMPQIESLRLSQLQNLKDLNFVKNMPNLKSLTLKQVPILNLDGLKGHLSLNSLDINCSSLEDVSVLPTLSSLQRLQLNYHTYDIPDLHSLHALKEIDIYEWDRKQVAHMPSIQKLVMNNYIMEYSASFMKGMKALSDLTIYGSGISGQTDPDLGSVLHELPSLAKLTYIGTPFNRYGDYGLAYAGTGAKEIIVKPPLGDSTSVNNPLVPVSLKKMKDDHTVESLTLNKATIINVDNESQNFSENAGSFLPHFKSLKKLVLSGDKLENLDCIKGLKNLEELDISDNYVSDLTPLLDLPHLKKVNIAGNPIANREVLPSTIEVLP